MGRAHTHEGMRERLCDRQHYGGYQRDARGRPQTTRRRTVEKEISRAGWRSWEVTKAAAENRADWGDDDMAYATILARRELRLRLCSEFDGKIRHSTTEIY